MKREYIVTKKTEDLTGISIHIIQLRGYSNRINQVTAIELTEETDSPVDKATPLVILPSEIDPLIQQLEQVKRELLVATL